MLTCLPQLSISGLCKTKICKEIPSKLYFLIKQFWKFQYKHSCFLPPSLNYAHASTLIMVQAVTKCDYIPLSLSNASELVTLGKNLVSSGQSQGFTISEIAYYHFPVWRKVSFQTIRQCMAIKSVVRRYTFFLASNTNYFWFYVLFRQFSLSRT